jgi:hypothetical protein
MLTSLTKWMKRKDDAAVTSRSEYATLISRLAVSDDLKPQEVDRLDALHAEFGAGSLETAAMELADILKNREAVKAMTAARRDAVAAEKAIASHAQAALKLAADHDAAFTSHQQAGEAIRAREQAIAATIVDLEGRAQKLRALETKHWIALGLESAPTPIVAPAATIAELERDYNLALEEITELVKASKAYKGKMQAELRKCISSQGEIDIDRNRAAPLEEQQRMDRISVLMARKRTASAALNAAREAAKPKPVVVRDYDGNVLDPFSILSPQDRTIEYRDTHPKLPPAKVIEAPNLSVNPDLNVAAR